MTETPYTPPTVWTWKKYVTGWRYAKTNRPIAGPTHEKELPVGRPRGGPLRGVGPSSARRLSALRS
jgi:hypothetical protein